VKYNLKQDEETWWTLLASVSTQRSTIYDVTVACNKIIIDPERGSWVFCLQLISTANTTEYSPSLTEREREMSEARVKVLCLTYLESRNRIRDGWTYSGGFNVVWFCKRDSLSLSSCYYVCPHYGSPYTAVAFGSFISVRDSLTVCFLTSRPT